MGRGLGGGVGPATLHRAMPRNQPTADSARHLRHAATPAEALIWEHLRAHRLDGHQFRRQHPIAGFIADFCCPRQKLIVELDGGVHRTRRSADQARDTALRRLGYRTLRFPNTDALTNIDSVLARIRTALDAPRP